MCFYGATYNMEVARFASLNLVILYLETYTGDGSVTSPLSETGQFRKDDSIWLVPCCGIPAALHRAGALMFDCVTCDM